MPGERRVLDATDFQRLPFRDHSVAAVGAVDLHALADLCPGGGIGQPVQGGLGAAGGSPAGQDRGERGGTGQVGVRVERDVHTVVKGSVDEVQQFAGPALVFGEVHGGVGEVEGAAGGPAQSDHLGVRVQCALAVGAVVRGVEAAQLPDGPAQSGQFLGAGIHSGRVGEPGGHPHGAFLHGGADHVLHLLLLGRRRVALGKAHHQGPDGSLRHEVGGVCGDPAAVFWRVEAVEVFAHRPPVPVKVRGVVVPAGDLLADPGQGGLIHRRIGQPVLAQEFGGDALAEFGVVVRVGQ